MELINSILGFIIAIGILVTFHEYGHFIVARLCNVKVLKFSVGFGKAMFKYQSDKNSTEYSRNESHHGIYPVGHQKSNSNQLAPNVHLTLALLHYL